MNDFFATWQPRILSLLRFITGFLFMWHGSQKLLGFPASQNAGAGLSPLMTFGGILELGGGILILIGLFTRWTAIILSGMMAVAYFMAHGTNAFLPIVNKGELAVLYSFVFFYLFFAGGGSVSVDSLISKAGEK